jgi:hypothetical protein
MQTAANPGSPALHRTPIYAPLMLAVIATSALSTACSSPAAEEPGWREVSPAPAATHGTVQPATTTSLGDPFVLIADSTEPARRLSDSVSHIEPNAEVQSAWAMLASDACDVELSSLHVAFRRTEHGPTGWLTTVESTPGIVLDASPSLAVVRYETRIRVDRDSGWSAGQDAPAIVDVEVHQDGDQVWMFTTVVSESPSPETALRLEFVVVGGFDQNPEVIPDRRFACPH